MPDSSPTTSVKPGCTDPRPRCTWGDCGAPAVAAVAEVPPVDDFDPEMQESLARNLFNPVWRLWRPLCDEHRAMTREAHDHSSSAGAMLLERKLADR